MFSDKHFFECLSLNIHLFMNKMFVAKHSICGSRRYSLERPPEASPNEVFIAKHPVPANTDVYR